MAPTEATTEIGHAKTSRSKGPTAAEQRLIMPEKRPGDATNAVSNTVSKIVPHARRIFLSKTLHPSFEDKYFTHSYFLFPFLLLYRLGRNLLNILIFTGCGDSFSIAYKVHAVQW